jgi:hypothetical protein
MLVLLMGGIYEVRRWNWLRWHDIHIHTKFHDDRFRLLSNITVITAIIWEAVMLALLIEGIYEARRLDGFTKIGTGVQAILRCCLRNLRGCNVGITDGRDLWIMPLRWAQVPWYIRTKFHKDWFRHSKVVRGVYWHTDSKVISQAYFYFFKIRKVAKNAWISIDINKYMQIFRWQKV